MTNSIEDLANDTKAFFVIGSNPPENHPVIGMKIKKAVFERGAKLIVADPRRTDLADFADVYMQHLPGTDVALLNGMMNVIIEEGLVNQKFVEDCTEGYEGMAEVVKDCTPEWAEKITSVPAELIRKAARIYAQAEAAAICYAMGLTQHSTGTDNVKSVSNLALLTGQIGRPGTGVNPLRGQNNVQGACDMGGLPNVFTGYQQVANPDAVKKFEAAWGVKLSDKPGLTMTEFMDKASRGEVKALYVIGENPVLSDPDQAHVIHAMEHLEFVVVQDIFMTETAMMADVVLPAACFTEKDGVFVNTERRVQKIRKAVPPPGEARGDWEILADLSTRMGYKMDYADSEAVFNEIVGLTPSYGGMSYARLEGKGLQWPCPTAEHPGTTYLHKEGKFTRGRGAFMSIPYRGPAETPDSEYPLYLTTGRSLYHYHTGSMTRRSKALEAKVPSNYLQINPDTAAKYGIASGDMVKVTTRRGSVEIAAQLSDTMPGNVIFTTFHFAEAAANILTNASMEALDPVAKIPPFKVSVAKISKA